jgi:hypothetical protein
MNRGLAIHIVAALLALSSVVSAQQSARPGWRDW